MNDIIHERKSSRTTGLLAIGAGVFFLLELATIAVAAWWGFVVFTPWPLKLLAGLGAPAVLIAVWARLGGPKAKRPVRRGWRAAFLAAWFGTAVVGLVAVGRPDLAVAFGVVALAASAADVAVRW